MRSIVFGQRVRAARQDGHDGTGGVRADSSPIYEPNLSLTKGFARQNSASRTVEVQLFRRVAIGLRWRNGSV